VLLAVKCAVAIAVVAGSDVERERRNRVRPADASVVPGVSVQPDAVTFSESSVSRDELHVMPEIRLAMVVAPAPGVLRSHQAVHTGAGTGEVTSGTFSPTLERSVGLARVPAAAEGRVEVDIRGKRLGARIVKPPFVRNGKSLIET
jgi:aminomethyltransferase